MPGSRSSQGGQRGDWVLGEFDDSLVVMPTSDAQRLAILNDGLQDAVTWADLLQRIRDEPQLLRDLRERYGEDLPDGTEPFDADEIAGFADGNWPAYPKREMVRWLPESIVALGVVSPTLFGGDFMQIDAARRRDVILGLRRLGSTCREDDDLVARACGAWRYA
jgi:hypothetical protein